jgi:hypothetical protein
MTGITSSLLSQVVSSPTTANQFATNLNQLVQDLQKGSLAAAQQDYVTLSEDALNGATSSTATTTASGITTGLLSGIASSSGTSTSFANELNQLGTDLQSNNLSSAQGDMLSADSTALNAATSATSSSATAASHAESAELIQTVIQGMEAGDDSIVSSGMSELASLSPKSPGASILQQDSQSYGSASGSSSSSSPISELLQNTNASSSDNSSSILSMLA